MQEIKKFLAYELVRSIVISLSILFVLIFFQYYTSEKIAIKYLIVWAFVLMTILFFIVLALLLFGYRETERLRYIIMCRSLSLKEEVAYEIKRSAASQVLFLVAGSQSVAAFFCGSVGGLIFSIIIDPYHDPFWSWVLGLTGGMTIGLAIGAFRAAQLYKKLS